MSVLIPLAVGLVLAGGASALPAAGSTTALSAPSRARTSHWAPPAASIAPVLCRTRFARRGGISRVERGVTSLGARTTVAPHAGWTALAVTADGPARSRRAAAIFERGPPPLS